VNFRFSALVMEAGNVVVVYISSGKR